MQQALCLAESNGKNQIPKYYHQSLQREILSI